MKTGHPIETAPQLGPDATVEEELAAARAAVRDTEQDLNQAIESLGRSIREPLSLTKHVRDNPTAWLAGAFAAGILLGHIGRRR